MAAILKGILTELDYAQSLGMDTFYLTPVFQARSYHRYDTDNYLHIDPALGGDAAFTTLQTEMDRRGMRLILDGVFNHASSDSLYFDRYHRYPTDGACESLTSRLPDLVPFQRQQRTVRTRQITRAGSALTACRRSITRSKP